MSRYNHAINDKTKTNVLKINNGEKRIRPITFVEFTDISDLDFEFRIAEADMSTVKSEGMDVYPTLPLNGGVTRVLTTYKTGNDELNQLGVELPQDILIGASMQPLPNKPVYFFFALEVSDQTINPTRWQSFIVDGLVQVQYGV